MAPRPYHHDPGPETAGLGQDAVDGRPVDHRDLGVRPAPLKQAPRCQRRAKVGLLQGLRDRARPPAPGQAPAREDPVARGAGRPRELRGDRDGDLGGA